MDTIDMGNKFVTMKAKYLFGFGLILTIVVIALIAVCVTNKHELHVALTECKDKIKETFDSILPKISNQPLVYDKNIKVAPGNCKPYSGCFFPSQNSNPINLNTGKRDAQPGGNEVWCEVSWRDCNAYQKCQKGKCVSKI